jgi:hypothetical protein
MANKKKLKGKNMSNKSIIFNKIIKTLIISGISLTKTINAVEEHTFNK